MITCIDDNPHSLLGFEIGISIGYQFNQLSKKSRTQPVDY
jgi:hypothetical protein